MRIPLFYLLACCLLFLSNGISGKPEANGQWQQSASLYLSNTAINGNTILHGWKKVDRYELQFSFLNEEDEDENSSIKKKATACSNLFFTNHNITCNNSSIVSGFNIFSKSFSYPYIQRYILHRAILV